MKSRLESATRFAAIAMLVPGLACSLDERSVSSLPSTAGTDAAGANSTSTVGAGGTAATGDVGSRPLDLLFVIDNSRSMAVKQELLGQVANALERFTHPACVDAAGNQSSAPPAGADCPVDQHRQCDPVEDIHLGVISTSLGDVGANDACSREFVESVDMAHLLGSLPRGSDAGANAQGFVSWKSGEDESLVTRSFTNLLTAAGEDGCGWEMPLEAWYRFLVDPVPYAGLSRVTCDGSTSALLNCVQPQTRANGQLVLDQPLLEQRQAFLRPNSRLGIVILTDENDCSVVVGPQSWAVLSINDGPTFARGSSACDSNPNDTCCYSCPLGPPAGCASDPSCGGEPDGGLPDDRLADPADGPNLRCFDQKRRFGADFLYPTARYVNALTQPTLCLSEDDLATAGCTSSPVPNPLFAGERTTSDVFLAGIVGVPWQLLEAQRNAPGRPAIESGFRYKLASELTATDWSAMIGDSRASPPVAPTSPFMIESERARPGVAIGNSINGREVDTSNGSGTPNDLEFACIFPLATPRDCATSDPRLCDCFAGFNDSAVCEREPGVSPAGTLQYWEKAYPGARELTVLQGLGQQGVAASICPRNTTNAEASDFSYRPAIAALVDTMAGALAAP